MNIRDMQAAIDEWIQDNGGYWNEMSLLARLTEEVGEVAREYNHRFGAKKKKASEGTAELADELGDVLWLVLCMANQQNIDLQDTFAATMQKLNIRDAGRFVSSPSEER